VDYEEPWWLLGAIHRIGAGEIHVSYVHRNATGTAAESANDVSLMALGYVYNLSRRTAVYTIAARLRNTGTGTVVIPNGLKTITPGGASSGFDIGIRHRF
jgi:predicted porin